MVYEIEIGNYPHQAYNLDLAGQSVVVTMKWNSVDDEGGFWTMLLETADGIVLSAGRRIKSGFPILLPYITGFIGNFSAVPVLADEEPLGLEPWGFSHILAYDDGA